MIRLLRYLDETPTYLTLPVWFPVAYVVGLFVAALLGAPIGSSAQ